MDIEKTTGGKTNTVMVKTNLWKCSLGTMVFQYKLVERSGKAWPLSEKFREVLICEIGKNTPENLLNKLVSLEHGLFYAVKIFNSISFRLKFDSVDYDFELAYTGNVEDQFEFMKCLVLSLLYKSQLIEIDQLYVNPFDIKETDEVALFPAFKFDFVKVDQTDYISVTNEMLFSPKVDLYTLMGALKDKGIAEGQLENIFKGKLIQTKYQSWAKYFKVTRVLFNESLRSYKFQKNGQEVPLLEYFRRKYPFLTIENEDQPLIMAVPVNSRFESIKEQKEKVLIPEMLHWILSNEDLLAIHGVDYYSTCKINKRAMQYFYMGKFITSLLDKTQIRSELFKWRVAIDRVPISMGFHNLEFNPTLSMISPQGQSRLERNLSEQSSSFYHSVLENRIYSYVPFHDIVVAFPRDMVEKAQKVVHEFADCLKHFKYSEKKPESIVVDNDEIESWTAALESKLSLPSQNRIVFCLTKNATVESQVRLYLMKKSELFKIKMIQQTDSFKYDCFRAHHDLLQLNQLLGGQPWIVNEIVEQTPIVVGGCAFQQLEGNSYLVTFTFSWNKNFTKYLTKMQHVADCQAEGVVAKLTDFFAKCRSSMMGKLGVSNLDFSAMIYLQICEKKKLYSSFNKEANLTEERCRQRNHTTLLEIFKTSVAGFGQKSLIAVECNTRTDISLFPCKSADSMDKTNVDYYSDFSQYNESRSYMFGSFPECLSMNFANNSRFILVSKYKMDNASVGLRITREAMVNEFNIFHTVSINQDSVKKWVMTNTILYACVDYGNIDSYVCLPVALKHSLKAAYKLSPDLTDITPDHVLAFNKYPGYAHLT